MIVSDDGGKSFASAAGASHGDWHDIWINPTNSKHIIGGDDGGLWISYDGGNKWWKGDNLPLSQFYHVSVDDKDPYQVYGGLQDNSSWVGDSAYPGGITNSRWENLFFGDGFWVFADPTDPNFVYAEFQGGNLGAGQPHAPWSSKLIQPLAGYKEKLRFNWNTPVHLSPEREGHDLHRVASSCSARATRADLGPDLARPDHQRPAEAEAGGVRRHHGRQLRRRDAHDHLFDHREPAERPGDLGRHRRRQRPADPRRRPRPGPTSPGTSRAWPRPTGSAGSRPAGTTPGTAFVTVDRHTAGDMAPYVYKTSRLRQDLARADHAEDAGVRGYAHVVKQDVKNPNLLFVGTEFGLWTSIDGGAHLGRSSSPTTSPPSRCATSPSSRATATWCWPRTAAASGSSTT